MTDRSRLVVGVDGSRQGDAALAFALDEAARSGDCVEVVTAWTVELPALSVPAVPMAGTPDPVLTGDPATHAQEIQDQALARVPAPPDVAVSRRIVQGPAGRALVEAAHSARLLVVGSRTMGAVKAALLGSVSRYCAHHAGCPVVVVPDHPEPVTTAQAPSPAHLTVIL